MSRSPLRLYALPVPPDGDRVGTVVAGVSLEPYDETATIALVGVDRAGGSPARAPSPSLSRWILGKALLPVSRMTEDAADWSDHDLDRRFDRGEPYDELTQLAATLDACSSASPRACDMSNGSPPSSPTSCERRSRGSQARASSRSAGSEPPRTTARASKRCSETPSR